MGNASTVLIAISALGTFAALIPCLGWLNWFTVPLSAACCIVGIFGLASERDPHTQQPINVGLHVAAIIVGVTTVVIGSIRCILGGFIL